MRIISSPDLVYEYVRNRYKQKLIITELIGDKELINYIKNLEKNTSIDYSSEMIHHDVILSFIRTVLKPEFKFKKNPMAYLKTIAKNVVLMQLRKKSIDKSNLEDVENKLIDENLYIVNEEKREVLGQLLLRINEECKAILELWAYQFKMSEIANQLGYSSEKYLKKKKGLCLKKLIAVVNKNPKLKSELSEYL